VTIYLHVALSSGRHTSLSKSLKLVDSMKADFLFFDLNLNTVVQEKTPET